MTCMCSLPQVKAFQITQECQDAACFHKPLKKPLMPSLNCNTPFHLCSSLPKHLPTDPLKDEEPGSAGTREATGKYRKEEDAQSLQHEKSWPGGREKSSSETLLTASVPLMKDLQTLQHFTTEEVCVKAAITGCPSVQGWSGSLVQEQRESFCQNPCKQMRGTRHKKRKIIGDVLWCVPVTHQIEICCRLIFFSSVFSFLLLSFISYILNNRQKLTAQPSYNPDGPLIKLS